MVLLLKGSLFGVPGLLFLPILLASFINASYLPAKTGAILKIKNKPVQIDEVEKNADFWLEKAEKAIQDQLTKLPITSKAKNVILFIGDGMSIPTLTAARIYLGQQRGESGENATLSFEKFPFTGLAKTYCVNKQVPDSACTATAYLSGVKANQATLGVTSSVKFGDCKASVDPNNQVTSILEWAQRAKKSTGIVTTTRVTHATPAGTYAHSSNRDWESDKNMRESRQNLSMCKDIAAQLIQEIPGRHINVILGGGRVKFRDNKLKSEEGKPGQRKDGADLIKEWIKDKEALGVEHEYVWNRDGLNKVDKNKTSFLLGLFSEGHMDYALKANKDFQPSLSEMTEAAIQILSRNEEGYFLLVEGGRIDHAHHDSQAHRALDETVKLSQAVETAVNMTDINDTLIVVTADHAHTMSHSGYPDRGSNILGIAATSDVDRLPFPILSYANGPGYRPSGKSGKRHNYWEDDLDRDDFKFPAAFPNHKETHGGDDVAVFAHGPWAHLLVGNYEQNIIPVAMAYASCLGSRQTYCNNSSS
ncbi:membrane-bound alkaline phosphatase-like [Lycorma delicatula]|uniref:membrane-bound alkaline phosphatase-like n=1 Tax=Lycorma delicatula TaxID=130591 RepID=UPI003F512B12